MQIFATVCLLKSQDIKTPKGKKTRAELEEVMKSFDTDGTTCPADLKEEIEALLKGPGDNKKKRKSPSGTDEAEAEGGEVAAETAAVPKRRATRKRRA